MSHHEEKHARQDNMVPESENQAAGRGATTPPDSAVGPRESTAEAERDTGAGTGGATESDGRPGHHEGIHLGNQPNS